MSIFRVALEDSDSDQYCISNNLNKKKRTGYQGFCMRSHIIELCRENEHVKARRSKNEYKAAELKCQHHLKGSRKKQSFFGQADQKKTVFLRLPLR